MLNEFKKQMWNDGPAKQPWLNYFNEYERTHCCFGDDDSDVGGADDEAFSTSKQGTATQSTTSDISDVDASGMSADQAQAVSDAIDEAEKAGASVTEMQNIAEGGNRAAEAGYTGQDLQTVAAANIDTDFFSPDNTYGVGSGFTSGVGSFADPFSDSGVGQTSFGSYVSDLETAAKGLASVSSIGVLSDLISNIAKEKGKPEAEVTQAEIDAVTSGVGPGAGIGEFSDVSPAQVAGLAPDDLSYAFAAEPGRALTSDDLSYAFAAQPPEDPIANQRGYGDAALSVVETRGGPAIDMTDAQLAVGFENAYENYSKAMAEAQAAKDKQEMEDELGFSRPNERSPSGFGDVPGYSSPAVGGGIDYASQVAADRGRPDLSTDVLDAIAREKSDRAKTTSSFDDEFYGPSLEFDPGATYGDVNLQAGLGDDQAQMFGGGYATESGRRDAMNAVEIADMISTYEEAERARSGERTGYGRAALEDPDLIENLKREALDRGYGPVSPGYGGAALGGMTDQELREGYTQEARDFANLDYTPTIGPFEEIQGDDPIILPKKKKEEEKPKSAMAQYFERLGVPSPYAPSSASKSPYLSAVAAQPAGAPEDLFARMARIRRQEALKTPKFNYAGFAPFSPNLYAAAYGISPEEARLRIPALPTLKQTIGLPDEDDEDETTEAYGGGGLRNLIRRQTGGITLREDPAKELQKLRIAQLGTAPQTAAERQALQKQKGFYRDDEGMVRDAQGNVQKDFGLPKGFPIGDEPKTSIDDEIMPLTTEDKPVLPIDVQEPGDPLYEPPPNIPTPETGDPLLDTVVYEPIDDVGTIPDKLTFLEGTGGPMIGPQPLSIDMGPGSGGAPMMGQQPQPTGLQGLGQFMQNPNYIPPSIRPVNLQQFGMQSPVPFGTQQPFSSGFSKFGQPMMGQTLRGTGF